MSMFLQLKKEGTRSRGGKGDVSKQEEGKKVTRGEGVLYQNEGLKEGGSCVHFSEAKDAEKGGDEQQVGGCRLPWGQER